MTDEQETNHAFARSRSNAGLCVFTADDFMNHHRGMLVKKLSHWCAPKNGFDDICVSVNHKEFHSLCSENPQVFTTRMVHGVRLNVTHNGLNSGAGAAFRDGPLE